MWRMWWQEETTLKQISAVVVQSCLTFCDSIGVFLVKILEWFATSLKSLLTETFYDSIKYKNSIITKRKIVIRFGPSLLAKLIFVYKMEIKIPGPWLLHLWNKVPSNFKSMFLGSLVTFPWCSIVENCFNPLNAISSRVLKSIFSHWPVVSILVQFTIFCITRLNH